MSIVCMLVAWQIPAGHSWGQRLASVFAPIAASLAVYFALARLMGMSEIGLLVRGGQSADESE